MAYKKSGSNLLDTVYGFGTATSFGGFSTSVANSHYKIGNVAVRYVPRNSNFMPFSIGDNISGYLSAGGYLFKSGAYAVPNRFVVGNTPRAEFSGPFTDRVIYYKGGGTISSTGVLRIGSTDYSGCPSVIAIQAQAAGGNGGGSRKDGIWVGQTFTGGGGGGSGAYYAFYMEMPYNTDGAFVEVLRFTISGYVSFKKNGSTFLTVNKGGDGQTPSNKEYGTRAGGAGGSVSTYALPTGLKICCFLNSSGSLTANLSQLSGVSGGRGGTGGGSFGAIVEKDPSVGGGSMPTYTKFYIDSFGNRIPNAGSTYTSGSGSSSGGGAGGGGGGSRMGSGGSGAAGGDGYGGGGSGGAGGTGAGGGGGSTGGSGFAVNYNGGKGGDAKVSFIW